MKCAHCKREVRGPSCVIPPHIVHTSCEEAFIHHLAGRDHQCPKCGTSGKVRHPTKTVRVDREEHIYGQPDCAWQGCRGCRMCISRKRTVTVDEPVMIECDLCEGHGYTKTKAEPVMVTVQKGWKLP